MKSSTMRPVRKRALSLVMLAALLISLLAMGISAASIPSSKITTTPATGYTSAGEVEYVTDGSKIANWGARGEDCVFLSTYAQSYYTGSYSFDTLSGIAGSKYQNQVPDSELYKALQNMLTAKQTYQNTYGETRYDLKYTDCLKNDTSMISSFYSGELFDSTWDGGTTWNREHTWPASKSLSGRPGNSTRGEGADIMMIRPALASENGDRSNTAYGEGSGYYDPGVSVRGDCARIALYVYVRWGNTKYMWGTSGVIQNLDTLLRWMEEDPVDTWEMGRNDAVQSITGVRNVFVDYPEFAWLLFGKDVPADVTTPSGKAGTLAQPEPTETEPMEPEPTEPEPTVASCSHFSTELRNKQAATCTSSGYSGDTYCKLCGAKLSSGQTIPATGHTEEIRDARQSTCAETGYTGDVYCSVCGEKLRSGEVLAKSGHLDFDGDQKCDICGTEMGCAHENREVRNASDGTCTSSGYTGDSYCLDCGAMLARGEEIPATGHRDIDGNGQCDTCGTELNCTHENREVRNVTEATCTDSGYSGDGYCLDCGSLLEPGTEIPALGHSGKLEGQTDATCGKEGYTGDTVCEVCGEVLEKGSTVPATGEHRYGDWVSNADGQQERICSVCGAEDFLEQEAEPGKPSGWLVAGGSVLGLAGLGGAGYGIGCLIKAIKLKKVKRPNK